MRLWSLFSEIIPLAAFFVVNALYGLIPAAVASLIASVVLLAFVWAREKRIATFVIFSILITAIMTLVAVLFQNELFIKMEATVFNGLFALVLLGGIAMGRSTMKDFFHAQFTLTDRTWYLLTLRWGLFFSALAIFNEVAWRNLSVDDWVLVKVMVLPPATALFALAQLPLTRRGMIAVKAESLPAPSQP